MLVLPAPTMYANPPLIDGLDARQSRRDVASARLPAQGLIGLPVAGARINRPVVGGRPASVLDRE